MTDKPNMWVNPKSPKPVQKMLTDIIEGAFSQAEMANEVTTDEYFGGCPVCGDTTDCLNVNRSHWMVCDKHKTKWCIGANLFSSWRDETEDVWRRNSETLAGYANVDPVSPDLSNCPRCNAQTIHYRSGPQMTTPHDPLCRKPHTDELSPLSDETVRGILGYLRIIGYHLVPYAPHGPSLDDEIPF